MQKHLSQTGTNTTCPVVVIVKNGKVLMGLRHYTPDKWKAVSVWTIPGGRCSIGEKIKITLIREVKEETGINDLKIVGYLGQTPGAKGGDIVPIFVGETNQEAKLLEPEKFSEWRWFAPNEFPENFINPTALELIRKHLAPH